MHDFLSMQWTESPIQNKKIWKYKTKMCSTAERLCRVGEWTCARFTRTWSCTRDIERIANVLSWFRHADRRGSESIGWENEWTFNFAAMVVNDKQKTATAMSQRANITLIMLNAKGERRCDSVLHHLAFFSFSFFMLLARRRPTKRSAQHQIEYFEANHIRK